MRNSGIRIQLALNALMDIWTLKVNTVISAEAN